MRWEEVLRAVASECTGDAQLVSIYGGSMRLTGSGKHRVPLLEWTVIADAVEEQWAPCTVQLDQFTKSMDAMVASERRLRALFHRDLPSLLGGTMMWAEYAGGEVLTDGGLLAEPERDNYFGRAVRFRLVPLREQYEQVSS